MSAPVARAEPANASDKVIQSGPASWYGPGFQGRKTASGETFNTNDMTAAHRTLPFGTKVKVVNKKTGKSVVVRINDRGPYAHGRVIDLSKASAQALGISGVGSVTLAQL
ncbi:septal ring lytic transglycosylase RlpA family protein [Microvirga sp. CF3062]|uniref:septal ring lytic transglycosylase RlpA family protein n=1 Tax=Microvirga sp. CF3062 TaxID=3110182 RepID=UPI002E798315|nr:septal ring lytic transglycosylase RlpA family protein [Microvirga sp. CF3062]MEE1656035.1 septal ring lytic transglycosylase RlpA family protein [Microvirga sp. CF3062]